MTIPSDIESLDIESAQLWVYKQPHIINTNVNFLISEVKKWKSSRVVKPFAIQDTNATGKCLKKKQKLERLFILFIYFFRVLGKNRHRPPYDQLDCEKWSHTCHRDFVQHMRSGSHIWPALNRQRLPTVHCGQHIHRPTGKTSEAKSWLCSRCVRVLSRKTLHFIRRNWLERLDCSSTWLWCVLLSWLLCFGCHNNDERFTPFFSVVGKFRNKNQATIKNKHQNFKEGINANQCTSVFFPLQKVMYQRNGSKSKSLELVPCCTSTHKSPLTLFYMDSNHTATQKTLPNMVVESCGCM